MLDEFFCQKEHVELEEPKRVRTRKEPPGAEGTEGRPVPTCYLSLASCLLYTKLKKVISPTHCSISYRYYMAK